MKLYHGSNQIIRKPDLSKGRYLQISAITLLIGIIVERNGLSEQEAIVAFYQSKMAQKLSDENILLRQMSPYLLYELWNAERTTGDYRKSIYASALL